MRRFAQTCDAAASTASKKERIRLAADYLGSLPVEEAARAAVFFCGQPFARFEEKVLAVGGSLLWQAVANLGGGPAERMQAIYRKHGDLGAMAEEMLSARQARGGLSVRDVAEAFEELATRRGPAAKLELVEALLDKAEPAAAKYIIKIITGDLRIGMKESLVEEAIAAAYSRDPGRVRRANMLTGDIGETLRLAAEDRLDAARLRLFRPVSAMLAAAVESPEEAMDAISGEVFVEDKYDGIRAQAHKGGGKVKLFSRTLDEIVEFSELLRPLAALPGEFVLDGEVLAWRDGRPLPFTELQQRLGRKQPELWLPLEIPVCYMAFDLLYLGGEPLLDLPLSGRRERLQELLEGAEPPFVQLAPVGECSAAGELTAAFEAALARGNEGVVIKAPGSAYTPGRRGRQWLKWKRPLATLDVVVTAVEYGHGKRAGLLSDYTFAVRDGERLLNIGKAYSGLTDQEIREFTRYFLDHTLQDQGFRRLVEPAVVLEVAFNNIQRSGRHESGYALRFPRIVRLRPDKPPGEIDTIERVRQIFERQKHPVTGE